MQVTLEEAYAEACRVIGEQIVQQRLLARTADDQRTPEGGPVGPDDG